MFYILIVSTSVSGGYCIIVLQDVTTGGNEGKGARISLFLTTARESIIISN